ncbi:pectate lyase PelA [Dickeya zeae]|uniref:pectate lyase PelA n=1 Tax=Dickeya zeae TaxID=204042 RepID=UPI002E36FE15|nr:pectate lyase PelA [Dickeya zeae]
MMKTSSGRSFTRSSTYLLATLIAGVMTSGESAAELINNKALESAPSVGWASQNGTTTGGAAANSDNIYIVTNISEFTSALSAGTVAKIIQIKGTIDISGGTPYKDFADQKARSQIMIPANTTVIGIGSDAKFLNGSLIIDGTDGTNNVIIRNVYIQTPIDVEPHYEAGDGWNAEWDGMNITNGAHHVWIDHVTITDGSFTDDMYTTKYGETYVQHDGALDIKRGSDYVTISNSLIDQHDKTMLIGHSDTNSAQDKGKLHVTLFNNVFNRVTERAPRVRYGSIHSFNNVFKGDVKDPVYRYLYSFGIGTSGSVLSEGNSFTIANLSASKACKIVKKFNGSIFSDNGSTLNGSAVDLSGCGFSAYTSAIPYVYTVQPMTAALAQAITDKAGSGKL